MTILDDKTARILQRWLDESRWCPGDEEYPGDPEIHPERQWRILRDYFDQDFDAALGKQKHPDAQIHPLEALALARLLSEGLRKGYWGLVYDARKAGTSWEAIGAALGISRQAAWEMYSADLANYAKKMENKVGADSFAKHRPEYESVLNDTADRTTEK